MRTKRRNAIAEIESVVPGVEACLSALGFIRAEHLFYRRVSDGDVAAKIEGISLRFEYGFRTCWLHATAKFPGLIELLGEVRPFAYQKELAWRAPDYASHVCCMLRLTDLDPVLCTALPNGMRWREDGRLQRARSVSAETLGRVMLDLVQGYAVPALTDRLTLTAVAAACDSPAYPSSGIAGAWSLAARVALNDKAGAARAFQLHPYSLGSDKARFSAAKEWLISKGVDVASTKWSQADADLSNSIHAQAWLSGSLLQ
jgi:hypothetical protein